MCFFLAGPAIFVPASELNTPESPEEMATGQLLSTGVTAAKAFAPTHLSTYRHGVEVSGSLGCAARPLLLRRARCDVLPAHSCACRHCSAASMRTASHVRAWIAAHGVLRASRNGSACQSGADHGCCCTELLQLGNSFQGAGTSTSHPGTQDCSGQPACPLQG